MSMSSAAIATKLKTTQIWKWINDEIKKNPEAIKKTLKGGILFGPTYNVVSGKYPKGEPISLVVYAQLEQEVSNETIAINDTIYYFHLLEPQRKDQERGIQFNLLLYHKPGKERLYVANFHFRMKYEEAVQRWKTIPSK